VKQWLRERAGGVPAGSRHVPLLAKSRPQSFEQITNKALQPSEKEVETNPRARSARLRAALRTEAAAFGSPADDGMDLPPISELEVSR
jgi:16S rRNA (cytosine1402-N4)-methyltransferase